MELKELLSKVTGKTLGLYRFNELTGTWARWYKGKDDTFHSYYVYNGTSRVHCERATLGMAKRCCEDWASLLINEKTDITLADEKSQKQLENIFAKTRFWQKANEGVEKTYAFGNGAWVVRIEGLTVTAEGQRQDGKVNVSFCDAFKMRPLTIEDDKITECAFITTKAKANRHNEKEYDIQVHVKNKDGNYDIYSIVAYGHDEKSLFLDETKPLVRFSTNSNIPWFVCLKPNIANNANIDSPLGISIYANAIDVLKSIDLVFDSYNNEFYLGRKRLFVNSKQITINSNGGVSNVFDSNDISIYSLPEDDDDINKTLKDSTQVLRVADHQNALQDMLNLFSDKVGFGTEHYKYNKGGVATATQIISENSAMFRNVKKQEILIENALVELVEAIAYASNTYTSNDYINADSIVVKFDDSIIEDKATEREQDRRDVNLGAMSKAEYRAKWYAEDEETAATAIDKIKQEQPPIASNVNSIFGLGDEI